MEFKFNREKLCKKFENRIYYITDSTENRFVFDHDESRYNSFRVLVFININPNMENVFIKPKKVSITKADNRKIYLSVTSFDVVTPDNECTLVGIKKEAMPLLVANLKCCNSALIGTVISYPFFTEYMGYNDKLYPVESRDDFYYTTSNPAMAYEYLGKLISDDDILVRSISLFREFMAMTNGIELEDGDISEYLFSSVFTSYNHVSYFISVPTIRAILRTKDSTESLDLIKECLKKTIASFNLYYLKLIEISRSIKEFEIKPAKTLVNAEIQSLIKKAEKLILELDKEIDRLEA